MSSRADSTSPPPYSFESSSFVPPPPRAGEYSRNWSYQAKFEAAEEPVRMAVLDTITAWTAPRGTQVWNYIPRSKVQDAYDAAAPDLKIALDFIVNSRIQVYLSDDIDRRMHEYFYLLDAGMKPPLAERALLSPQAFANSYTSAHVDVQTAVVGSWVSWYQRNYGKSVQHSGESVLRGYAQAPHELKTCLNWILDAGSISRVDCVKSIPSIERFLRKSIQEDIRISNWVKPVF